MAMAPKYLEPEDPRSELERRAAEKANDIETWQWAVDTHEMLATASADGTIKELLRKLGQ